MLQGQLVWQAGAWGVYREIRACCLLARLKLDEELGRVFISAGRLKYLRPSPSSTGLQQHCQVASPPPL